MTSGWTRNRRWRRCEGGGIPGLDPQDPLDLGGEPGLPTIASFANGARRQNGRAAGVIAATRITGWRIAATRITGWFIATAIIANWLGSPAAWGQGHFPPPEQAGERALSGGSRAPGDVPRFAEDRFESAVLSPAELKSLSLEDLIAIEVTSVSKYPEPLSEAASAIQVITGEEIRRSGATNLPEALRLASNLQVAQVNASQWAISARGFNNVLANKLLVQIDGRSVYTPLYAGVFWDVQNVLLEDVDRIEVVSGPGGSLWGANAVNGIINIITKSARETQGVFVRAGGGTEMHRLGRARAGAKAGDRVYYRVY
jgi:hypothetical protein